MNKGISLDQVNGAEQRTALHVAIVRKHESIALFLISSGAKVNVKDCYGCTPLHDAAEKGLPAVAGALVSKGARLDEASTYSGMPLHRAVAGRREVASGMAGIIDLDEAEDMEKNPPPQKPLKPEALEVARFLLSKGAKPNVTNSDGQTPLDMALGMKDDEMVKLLHSHGGKQAKELKENITPEGRGGGVK